MACSGSSGTRPLADRKQVRRRGWIAGEDGGAGVPRLTLEAAVLSEAGVTRFILAILLAFSLASATGPALAGLSAHCPMAVSGMADHEDMGCCTPDCAPECALVCPGAVVPSAGEVAGEPQDRQSAAMRPVGMPPSRGPGAADPPPRTTNS